MKKLLAFSAIVLCTMATATGCGERGAGGRVKRCAFTEEGKRGANHETSAACHLPVLRQRHHAGVTFLHFLREGCVGPGRIAIGRFLFRS